MPFDNSPSQELVVIRAARALIERGWCQHRWTVDSEDRICLEAAVSYAAHPFSIGTLVEVLRLLRRLAGRPDLSGWNDERERTREDVLDLLDRAARLA